jgi:hypothetical protein
MNYLAAFNEIPASSRIAGQLRNIIQVSSKQDSDREIILLL